MGGRAGAERERDRDKGDRVGGREKEGDGETAWSRERGGKREKREKRARYQRRERTYM